MALLVLRSSTPSSFQTNISFLRWNRRQRHIRASLPSGCGHVLGRVPLLTGIQIHLVFNCPIPYRAHDLQGRCVVAHCPLLANQDPKGNPSRRRRTNLQSIHLLGCIDMRHALDLPVLRRSELHECKFISNAARFGDGVHGNTQVRNLERQEERV